MIAASCYLVIKYHNSDMNAKTKVLLGIQAVYDSQGVQ